MKHFSSKTPEEYQNLVRGIERISRNWLFIKIQKTDSMEHNHLIGAIERYRGFYLKSAFLGNIPSVLSQFIGILLLVLVILLSQNYFHTPATILVAFLYLFMRFVQNLAHLATNVGYLSQNVFHFRQAFDYFFNFTTEEMRTAQSYNLKVTAHPTASLEKLKSVTPPGIVMDKVSFHYPHSRLPVIHRFSLKIRPGSQFGIMGPSGSGKSTLLCLLMNILSPQKGTIRYQVDGKDFPSPEFIRMGYVGAEPYLIEGTLEENIVYGNRHKPGKKEIERALKLSRLDQFVKSLPQGLAYRLTENGDGLSAGQKQRLCLARALVTRPQLLILDEASANLDIKTEDEIADSLRSFKGGVTTLIVSHRKGILKHCDDIYVLKK